MKNLLLGATAALCFAALAPAANATVMTVSFSEPTFATFTSAPSGTGSIVVVGPGPLNSYGTYTAVSASGQDQSALAIPGILNSQTLEISTATAGVMTVDVKSTGLAGVGMALGKSSFAVNDLNGSITSITETTMINGVVLATHDFNGINTNVQFNLVDLGPGGTFTAEDIFVITSVGGGLGNANLTIDLSGTTVPEPASLALLGVGLLGVGFVARRKRSV
jgi:hypothetical protein